MEGLLSLFDQDFTIGRARAVEALRTIMAQFKIVDVREQFMLFLADDFENGMVKILRHPLVLID